MELIKNPNQQAKSFQMERREPFRCCCEGGGGRAQIGAHQHFWYTAVYGICYILIYTFTLSVVRSMYDLESLRCQDSHNYSDKGFCGTMLWCRHSSPSSNVLYYRSELTNVNTALDKDTYQCTICKEKLYLKDPAQIREHPKLKVVICRVSIRHTCSKHMHYYSRVTFRRCQSKLCSNSCA